MTTVLRLLIAVTLTLPALAVVPIGPPVDLAPIGGPRPVDGVPKEIAVGSQSMLALWSTNPYIDVGFPSVLVRPLDHNGQPLSPAQIELGTGHDTAIAANHDRFLVLWESERLMGALFGAGGALLRDAYPLLGGGTWQGPVELTAEGDGWRAFRSVRGTDGSPDAIETFLINREGDAGIPSRLLDGAYLMRAIRHNDLSIVFWWDSERRSFISAVRGDDLLHTTAIDLGPMPLRPHSRDLELTAAEDSVGIAVMSESVGRFFRYDPDRGEIDGPHSLPSACAGRRPLGIELAWVDDRYIGLCEGSEQLDATVTRPVTWYFEVDEYGETVREPERIEFSYYSGLVHAFGRIWVQGADQFAFGPVELREVLRPHPAAIEYRLTLSTTASSQSAPAVERWSGGLWFAIWNGETGIEAAIVDRSGVRERELSLDTTNGQATWMPAATRHGDEITAAWIESRDDGNQSLTIARWRSSLGLEPADRFQLELDGAFLYPFEISAFGRFAALALGPDSDDSRVLMVDLEADIVLFEVPVRAAALSMSPDRLVVTYIEDGALRGDLYSIPEGNLLHSAILVSKHLNPDRAEIEYSEGQYLLTWPNYGHHIRTKILDEEMNVIHGGSEGTIVTEGRESGIGSLAAAPSGDGNWVMSWIERSPGAAYSFTIRVGPRGELITPLPHEPRHTFAGQGYGSISPDGSAIWGAVFDRSQSYGGAHRARILLAPTLRQRPVRAPGSD